MKNVTPKRPYKKRKKGVKPDTSKYVPGRSRRPEGVPVPPRNATKQLTNYEKWGNGKTYEHLQNSKEYAEKMHTNTCKVCLMENEVPGSVEMIKQMYFRFMSAVDIEELIGYVDEEVTDIDAKTGEVITYLRKVPICPDRSIRRHAMFYGWQTERSRNTNGLLDIVINIGFEQVLRKGEVSEQMMMSAMDMRNKLDGQYFKASKNPKEIKAQMMATVMTIVYQHHAKGMTDVTVGDVIESLSKRPGFEHVKIILREELQNERRQLPSAD